MSWLGTKRGHALGLFREPFVKVRDALHPRELLERLYVPRMHQSSSTEGKREEIRWNNVAQTGLLTT